MKPPIPLTEEQLKNVKEAASIILKEEKTLIDYTNWLKISITGVLDFPSELIVKDYLKSINLVQNEQKEKICRCCGKSDELFFSKKRNALVWCDRCEIYT